MKSNNPCISATVSEALERLPGPDGQRFATVFEHGSLLVEIYAPRGTDPQQPHTRDEIYFVAAGTGEFVAATNGTRLVQPTYSLPRRARCIALKTFLVTSRSGSCFMVRKAASRMGARKMAKLYAVAACFPVADIGATIRWYEEQLGFAGDPFPDCEPYVFGILRRDDVEIFLQRIVGYEKPDIYRRRDGGVWDAYIRVEDIQDLYESVREKVTIVQPLRQQPYGAWEFEVKDPNGYILVFGE